MDELKDPIAGLDEGVGGVKPIQDEQLRYVFMPGRDQMGAKPYAEDGNTDFYCQKALEERQALRTNPNVMMAITKFIEQNNFSVMGTTTKYVSKEDYITVFTKVGTVLRPGEDADTMMEVIREEFEQDINPNKAKLVKEKVVENQSEDEDGNKAAAAQEQEEQQQLPPANPDQITLEQLEDALFELADTWCPSISESQYVEFFEQLAPRANYNGYNDPGAYDLLHNP